MEDGFPFEHAKPSIAYVDEHEDERDNFFTDAYDSDLFEEIYLLPPEKDLNDLVVKLIDLNVDALVTDFNLSEAAPLSYDGEKLVLALLSARSEFPCFIRTSFDDQAIGVADDVNRVYSKNVAKDTEAGRDLFRRVVQQVYRYRKKTHEWQDELCELLEILPENRTASQVERALFLDAKIEALLGKDVSIPGHVKKDFLRVDTALISAAEELITKIKRELGE